MFNQANAADAARFTAHMLHEMARMSAEDGLVMQLHVGSLRNHNQPMFDRFGPDIGARYPGRRRVHPQAAARCSTPLATIRALR